MVQELTREQYAVVEILATAIRVADTGYSASDEEKEWSQDEWLLIRKELAKKCSKNQIENTIDLLNSISSI